MIHQTHDHLLAKVGGLFVLALGALLSSEFLANMTSVLQPIALVVSICAGVASMAVAVSRLRRDRKKDK